MKKSVLKRYLKEQGYREFKGSLFALEEVLKDNPKMKVFYSDARWNFEVQTDKGNWYYFEGEFSSMTKGKYHADITSEYSVLSALLDELTDSEREKAKLLKMIA